MTMEEMNTYLRFNIPCKIDVIADLGIVEILAVIEGRAKIEEFEYLTEILGKVNLDTNGISNLEIPSKIEVRKMMFSKDILAGVVNYERSGFDTKGSIEGKLVYTENELEDTLLDGRLVLAEYRQHNLLHGKLNLVGEDVESVINGRLEYESDTVDTEIKGKVVLDEYNEVVKDLIEGKLYFERDEYIKDLCSGRLVLYNKYIQTEFPCRIAVKQKKYKYSIFSKIDVVNGFELEFPGTISVDGTTEVDTSIEGKVNVDKEDYSTELFSGRVDVYPHVFTYIDGKVTLDSTYTRREFNSTINIVQEGKIEIPCKITIKERDRVNYINNLLLCRAILGNRMSYTIDSKISIRNLRPEPDAIIPVPTLPGVAGGRIVIAVSPTWSYNPFVFKSSLITFLDRYYGTYDFNFVFGGNPRSDWDILNLCNNFKIDKKKLHQVKFRFRFNDPMFNKVNVDHFIEHMFMDYPNKEYNNILRVFLFMNQPSWYYNDPLAKIAEVCKMNDISCVAINSGGEYQEINEINKLRDTMYNNLEWDRQNRMQRDIYHIVSTDIDPTKIVY